MVGGLTTAPEISYFLLSEGSKMVPLRNRVQYLESKLEPCGQPSIMTLSANRCSVDECLTTNATAQSNLCAQTRFASITALIELLSKEIGKWLLEGTKTLELGLSIESPQSIPWSVIIYFPFQLFCFLSSIYLFIFI